MRALFVVVTIAGAVGWTLLFMLLSHPRELERQPPEVPPRPPPPRPPPPPQTPPPPPPPQKPSPGCAAEATGDGFSAVEATVSIGQVGGLFSSATTICAAKAECRRLSCGGFAWAGDRVVAVNAEAGPTKVILFKAVNGSFETTLEAALGAWDKDHRLQLSAMVNGVARQMGWGPLGGPPTKIHGGAHSYIDEGLRIAWYDAFAVSHELIAGGSNKIMETRNGLCDAKDVCAMDSSCAGFVYRHRDGVAVLYAKIVTPRGWRSALPTNNKVRRLVWLYVKRKKYEQPCLPLVREEEEEEEGQSKRRRSDEEDQVRHVLDRYFATTTTPASSTQRCDEDVTVTLTTLPGRITQIKPVLESLLLQTVIPREIVVQVPLAKSRLGDVVRALPEWLRTMDPRIRINRPAIDLGPATKLIPALQEARGDTLIIVVDDDTLYPPRFIETLVKWACRFPNAAVATTGWPVPRTLKYPHWTENYLVYGNELLAPHPVSVIRGNCGFAVRPRFFDPTVWTTLAEAPKMATLMDDVWFSGHLAKRNVPRFVVPSDTDQFTRSPEFKDVITLDSGLRTGGQKQKKPGLDRKAANDAALRYFSDYWDVFWDPPKLKVDIVSRQTAV